MKRKQQQQQQQHSTHKITACLAFLNPQSLKILFAG